MNQGNAHVDWILGKVAEKGWQGEVIVDEDLVGDWDALLKKGVWVERVD